MQLGFTEQLGHDLNLLSSSEQITKRNACDSGHFSIVIEAH